MLPLGDPAAAVAAAAAARAQRSLVAVAQLPPGAAAAAEEEEEAVAELASRAAERQRVLVVARGHLQERAPVAWASCSAGLLQRPVPGHHRGCQRAPRN